MPNAITKKIRGFKVKIKTPKMNKFDNNYIILMENLFYTKDKKEGGKGIRTYDLKGSKLNRYIPKREQKIDQVLPDTNFKV